MTETSHTEQRILHWRALTSLIVTLAFLGLAATGVILYITPRGRVANWTGWTVWGLRKEQWVALHTSASLLFVIASSLHVYFNWRVLVRYLVQKRRLHLKREMIGAVAVVAAVFAGSVFEVPPFSSIVALNGSIKAHWERRSARAPYPHAELSTLSDFSERTGISRTVLLERLVASGITADDATSRTLEELAKTRGLSPNELFARITGTRASGGRGMGSGGRGMGSGGRGMGSGGRGMGPGRQTLENLCESNGIPLEKALSVLRQQGFAARAESTLRSLADEKGMSPAEVRDLIIEKNK
jgi:uncharacterized membrane protein YgcG